MEMINLNMAAALDAQSFIEKMEKSATQQGDTSLNKLRYQPVEHQGNRAQRRAAAKAARRASKGGKVAA